jgi:uncharacterized protein (TIGR00255 family)
METWSSLEMDERVMREIAFIADKVDIAEEISRLEAHIAFFPSLFKQERVGKNMEFYIQEMMRETNTIASKSADHSITSLAIQMKNELERMREQVQNVE